MKRVVIIHAGLRVPSSTKLLADNIAAALQGNDVQIVALRDHAHAIVDAMLTGLVGSQLDEAIGTIARADALAVVTPTFSASYSGLFKSFFDILEPGLLKGKPVLLAATGGTSRHSLVIDYALRPLLSYLGAQAVRTGVFAATEDFGGTQVMHLRRRIAEAVGELTGCLGAAPAPEPKRDTFDEVTAFEELLSRNKPSSTV